MMDDATPSKDEFDQTPIDDSIVLLFYFLYLNGY